MKTYEDCIHYEVCGGYIPTDLDKDIWDLCAQGKSDEIPDIEKRCSSFKDKSRFIELPCFIGDYCIYENKIWYILQITYFGSDDDFVLSLTDIVSSRFKKIFASEVKFISKEESENKLEELNE